MPSKARNSQTFPHKRPLVDSHDGIGRVLIHRFSVLNGARFWRQGQKGNRLGCRPTFFKVVDPREHGAPSWPAPE